jgi:hypothetical protein
MYVDIDHAFTRAFLRLAEMPEIEAKKHLNPRFEIRNPKDCLRIRILNLPGNQNKFGSGQPRTELCSGSGLFRNSDFEIRILDQQNKEPNVKGALVFASSTPIAEHEPGSVQPSAWLLGYWWIDLFFPGRIKVVPVR